MPARGATWLSPSTSTAAPSKPTATSMAVSLVNGVGGGSSSSSNNNTNSSSGGSAYYVPAWRYINYRGRGSAPLGSANSSPTSLSPPPPPSGQHLPLTGASAASLRRSYLGTNSRLPSSIARDPRLWSREDVRKWLLWCQDEFDLPSIDANQFLMNGKALCLLMKSDFIERAPGAGDVLHNAVHLLLVQATVSEESALQHYRMYSSSGGSLVATADSHGSSSWATAWPCVSSDYHNVGHVIHQSCFDLQANNGGVDSTVTLSPAPSTDSQSGSPRRDEATNGVALDLHSQERLTTTESGGSDSGGSPAPPPSVPTPILGSSKLPANSGEVSPTEQVSPGLEQPVTNGRLLWDFLHQLLNDPAQRYVRCIAWKERDAGVFKIVDPHGLAQLWGMQKNHLNMNFDKMSRALRYYYRVNILKKVQGERHCYQFLRQPIELKACKQRALLTKYCAVQPSKASLTVAEPLPVAIPIKSEMDSP